MQKDFDTWNERKKFINNEKQNKSYHEKDIWWCSLGLNIGFEQDGKGDEGERPVIILKGFSRHVCLVLPLTTSQKQNPSHVSLGFVASKESYAIISQLRLIDTKRLKNKIGHLEKNRFIEIRKAVRELF